MIWSWRCGSRPINRFSLGVVILVVPYAIRDSVKESCGSGCVTLRPRHPLRSGNRSLLSRRGSYPCSPRHCITIVDILRTRGLQLGGAPPPHRAPHYTVSKTSEAIRVGSHTVLVSSCGTAAQTESLSTMAIRSFGSLTSGTVHN